MAGPPEPEEIVAVTFLLELPSPVPVPDDTTVLSYGERGGWTNWSGEQMASFIGARGEVHFHEGVAPGRRLIFRSSVVRTAPPLQAADLAFGDWARLAHTEEDWRARNKELKRAIKHGIEERRSVVAVSHFVPAAKLPSPPEELEPLLWEKLDASLAGLNEFISMLGLTTGDWRIMPTSVAALPAFVPVLLQSSHQGEDDWPPAVTRLLALHDRFPTGDAASLEPEQIERVAEMTNRANRGEEPFMLVLRLLHRASVEFSSRRLAEATLGLGTAIEVLISMLIREAGGRRGWGQTEINEAEQATYRKRLVEYLAKALGGVIAIDDPADPWGRWWEKGYLLRNRIAHEGHDPSRAEADAAWDSAAAVLTHSRETLEADPVTADLAPALHVEVRRGNRPSPFPGS